MQIVMLVYTEHLVPIVALGSIRDVFLAVSLVRDCILECLLVEKLKDRRPDEYGARGDDCDDHVDIHQEAIHHQRYVAPIIQYLQGTR